MCSSNHIVRTMPRPGSNKRKRTDDASAVTNPKKKPSDGEAAQSATESHENRSIANMLVEKSPMWPSGPDGGKPQRSRKRAAPRKLTTSDRPYMFTRGRTKNLLLTMAFCGLRGVSFRKCVVESHARGTCADAEVIDTCGAMWSMAFQMQHTYTDCINNFLTTLKTLYNQNNPTGVPNSFYKLIAFISEAMATHSPCATAAPYPTMCCIEGRGSKTNEPIMVVTLRRYIHARLPDGKVDYFRMRVLPESPPVTVNKKYWDLGYAAWYLFNLHNIIGDECIRWVESIKKMPTEERETVFPSFPMTDAVAQANLYIDTFADSCDAVGEMIKKHATLFERLNTDYKKKIKPAPQTPATST